MEIALKHRNLIDLFEESTLRVASPDKVCTEILSADRHETLTFGQLRAQTHAFAHRLAQQEGIGPRDRVALVSKNRTDWDVALWGVLLAGAVPVLIDPERGPQGVIAHLEATDARGLILADDYATRPDREELTSYAETKGLRVIPMTGRPLGEGDCREPHDLGSIHKEILPDDTAVVLCTSGTTGDPREVELTHANLIANLEGSLRRVDLGPRDVLGHILPPHHSFGLTVGKMLPLLAAATGIYTNRYREVADLIRDRRITIFIAIPALFTTLARKLEDGLDRKKRDSAILRFLDRHFPRCVGRQIRRKQGWTGLRFFLSGAAPMPRWVLDTLWRRGFRMYEGYGTTENSPVYGFNERLEKLGSVGRPIDTLSVKIVDEENRTLAPHQKGEICLGGPCIMKGYYRNPQATEAAIRTDSESVRWLHTGDLGYLDEDGYLYITGRKKYLIILPGGKNVNPERVETALSQARFVKEVLVVPTRRTDPDGVMEETMRALVHPAWETLEDHTRRPKHELLSEPHTIKGLVWESIRCCQSENKHLSGFERIAAHQLEIHENEFAKTSTGKIRREQYIDLAHLEAKHTPVVGYSHRPSHTRDQDVTAV
ncbi:class I adenylate-forming enzyme family protein [Anaerobaca lacustris]|uniref:Class I adenylate-forming enzyme family protein n=1 Tax=Anaerobaca lacustris TaxID=3044600 RepID=A0AAW6TWG0_9BACT|nr:class I adenylate-forming enzyme family protein [Sedimentisphaerales bacterium M17dextr]